MATLDDLLDQAADALLRGDLAALAALSDAIERASEGMTGDGALAETARRKAERNARLLQAAARGVRAARERLAEITSGPVLNTYDALGRRAAVQLPQAPAKRL